MAPASEGLCLPESCLIRVLEAYSTVPGKQARGRMGGWGVCGCAEKAMGKHWGGEKGSGLQDRVCPLFQEE